MLKKNHENYMNLALNQARKAFAHDEVPVGAVVIDGTGQVIARAYNQVEKKQTQAAHAELLALAKAGKKMGNWRLNECWLYVTLEPCMMCMSLIRLSRIAGLVFAARSPLFGYTLDKDQSLSLYKKDSLEIITRVGKEESEKLLKEFFAHKRRRNSDRSKTNGAT